MKHFSEEELVAYQLCESDDASAVRKHLELCPPCAAVSDAIAETLRMFSAEKVHEADLDGNWRRLRSSLRVLEPEPRRRFHFLPSSRVSLAIGLAAVVLVVGIIGLDRRHNRELRQIAAPTSSHAINGRGPLTTEPVDLANHLDAAERLLTEVNHATGPLDHGTRTQAHDLLLKNAVYVRTAQDQGNFGEAVVLENLSRVLTFNSRSRTGHPPRHMAAA